MPPTAPAVAPGWPSRASTLLALWAEGLSCPCAIDSSLAAISSAACRCWPSASRRSTMTLVRVSVSSLCSAGEVLAGAARAAPMLGGAAPVKTISSLGDLGRSPAEMLAASAMRRSASCIPSPLSSAPRNCPSCAASRRLSAAFSACSPARREPRAATALLLPGALLPSSSLEHMDCAVGERGEVGSWHARSSPIQAPPIRGWKPPIRLEGG
mmetsp:Transcript_3157/g.8222  ORF Transcript_3157/g.8222 Transcript_3157/m.8222 type:complete len:212 (+) Transcript_3157:150-785(+)